MSGRLDQSSVEELDRALRLYRRLVFRLLGILVLGFVAVILLSKLGSALSPPYGLYIYGLSLTSLGLIGVLVLLFVEMFWEGRQIGSAERSGDVVIAGRCPDVRLGRDRTARSRHGHGVERLSRSAAFGSRQRSSSMIAVAHAGDDAAVMAGEVLVVRRPTE